MKHRLHRQRGATMLVVMVLLTVMLLGALALARVTDVSTLASGNAAYRDGAIHASEVGLNTAFTQVQGLLPAAEGTAQGTWYYTAALAEDANGLPIVNWDNVAPATAVGAFTVKYIVERMCSVGAVTNPLRECLVREVKPLESANANNERLLPLSARQFRATIRVTGPKGTTTFVQSLMTRG